MTEPNQEAETPDATDRAAKPSSGEPAAPLSKEKALKNLRTDGAELASVRSAEIVAESVSRAGGVAHINIYSGGVRVEGDFLSGTSTSPRAPRRRAGPATFDADTLTEEYDRYVQPPDFTTCVDKLDLGHLLVLADRARTGRDARAHAALVAVLRRNNMPVRLSELPVSVLGSMAWQPPHRECAYVVRDVPDGRGRCAAESITEKWLTHAAAQARAHDSYLVVVTGPVRGELATAENRSEYVMSDLYLPEPGEIVRRRVLARTAWLTERELDERLAGTGLADILDERDDPRFAARVAEALATGLHERADLAAVVDRLRDPEDHVREWLGADPDAADVALVLATAALEGSGYLSVADAAVTLCRKLGGGSGPMMPRYLRKLLAERSWIELVPAPDRPTVVRFRHAGLRPAVLALTWFELDGARPTVLDWLAGLADHEDVEVRARAASAAGLLAARDLQHGLHQFFLPWARNRSAPLRQSAATGLNVAGTVSGHNGLFWRHVEQWAELALDDEDARELPATAALAAGGTLGVAEPRRALRVLHTLVDADGWDLLEPVALSTDLLLAAGHVGPVIEALLDWTDATTVTEPVVRALSVFAFTAGGLSTANTERPVLLGSAAELRDELPELWGRALACEPVRPLAADALRVWVHATDRDPELRPDVLDLLAGVADRGDADYGRLCHLLEKWADDPDDPSPAAGHFHTELVEEGELVS